MSNTSSVENAAEGGDISRCIAVQFNEHRESGDEADRTHRLATIKFNPRRGRHAQETLSPRYSPSLFATISYYADTETILVMVLREKQDLVTLDSRGPSDAYVTVRLSQETTLSILI